MARSSATQPSSGRYGVRTPAFHRCGELPTGTEYAEASTTGTFAAIRRDGYGVPTINIPRDARGCGRSLRVWVFRCCCPSEPQRPRGRGRSVFPSVPSRLRSIPTTWSIRKRSSDNGHVAGKLLALKAIKCRRSWRGGHWVAGVGSAEIQRRTARFGTRQRYTRRASYQFSRTVHVVPSRTRGPSCTRGWCDGAEMWRWSGTQCRLILFRTKSRSGPSAGSTIRCCNVASILGPAEHSLRSTNWC
mmetsp:Transcript_32269/g.49919  ORF Transcript_32269/g.49919 Transcript_32269/m.49919 type:complete len:245 (-) Transcript_32269:308-1042(-)